MQAMFKFKVLDTSNNKVYSSLEDLSKEEPNAHFLLGQDGEIIKKYYNNGEIQLIRMSCYKPLLCTSRHDKNKKLIYQGDIITYDDRDLYPNTIVKVAKIEFIKCQWVMSYYDKRMVYAGTNKPYLQHTWIGFDDFFNTRAEIIGNIYENPELLEQGADQ